MEVKRQFRYFLPISLVCFIRCSTSYERHFQTFSNSLLFKFFYLFADRYRIQTDAPELLHVVAEDLIERLTKTMQDVHISTALSLEYIVPKLEEYLDVSYISLLT